MSNANGAEEYTANIVIEPPPAPSRKLEVSFAAGAVIFSVIYLIMGFQIELRREAAPGQIDARFFPILIGIIALVTSIAMLVFALIKEPPTREDLEKQQSGGMRRVAAALIISIAYVFVWSLKSVVIAGYRIEVFPFATALFIFGLIFLFGQRKIAGLIIYPLAITAFIWVLFGMLLRIPL
ncbi:tripartite tricarboxylate transporter TctB family protein [Microbacterium sp. NC79]|uniref:tripartite tricarboxylate transporter TctB family protein n=1 Tax=Microbacterium sp. NC79 TaxID=2851009 RepID=UPI00349F5F93